MYTQPALLCHFCITYVLEVWSTLTKHAWKKNSTYFTSFCS